MRRLTVALVMGLALVLPSGRGAAAPDVPFKDVMNAGQLDETLGRWRKARESYLRELYGRAPAIQVHEEGVRFLRTEYSAWLIPARFMALDRRIVSAAVRTEVEALMNAAFFASVRSNHGSYVAFVDRIPDIRTLVIGLKDITEALGQRHCKVIPCNPKECKPTDCGEQTFQQLQPLLKK